ncbi:MAG: hypothetical protein J6K87_00470, partial [Clostridia bacterium]|nr:hypothetical protein [Clostridia bacterium]
HENTKIKGCICVGLGTSLNTAKTRTFKTCNLACITNDESVTIGAQPKVLDSNLLKSVFTPYNSDDFDEEKLDFTSHLFDLKTGAIYDNDSSNIKNLVSPISYYDQTLERLTDGLAMLFKITLETNEKSAVLADMIDKTKEYIGEGIYHLFDYQFLYNTVVNLITSGM